MRKRWAAGALLTLPLLWMGLVSPLAWAQERTADAPEAASPLAVQEAPAGTDRIPVEIAEDTGSLAAMRAVRVPEVPEENRDAVRWALYRELLSPREGGAFDGEEPVSRGEAVQALYRLSGISVRVDKCPYPDVPEEYQDAVAWAAACGVSGGAAEDRFSPGGPVTRSQLAVMLNRFAAWRGENVESRTAVAWDGEAIPAYAAEAVNWVMDRNLYAGMTERGFYPALPVSRLQLACILARLQRDRDPLAENLSLPEAPPASRSEARHEELSQAVAAAAMGRWGSKPPSSRTERSPIPINTAGR